MIQRWRRRRERRGAARGGLGCALLLSLAAALGGLILAFGYAALFRDLPSLAALPDLLSAPDGSLLQPTRLYDRLGQEALLTLRSPASGEFVYLHLGVEGGASGQAAPTALISATLALQDPAFWTHPGLSPYSLLPGGRPGLAEELAGELLLGDEPPGWPRRMRARLLAVQITGQYGRQQVLEWALNSRDYGELAYGAEAGARHYFGKPAAELSLPEAALLAAAGLDPQNNPHTNLPAARRTQGELLQAMARLGWITQAEAARAAAAELAIAAPPAPSDQAASWLTALALQQLETQLEPARYSRGLKVITTLDSALQQAAACALAVQLARLQAVDDEPDCPAARLLPALPPGGSANPGPVAGAALALDARSGQILAMVSSSPDPEVFMPARPGGTLLAPFVYLTAFTRGLGPASLLWDLPTRLPTGEPGNFDGLFHGALRLRTAAANNYLAPLAQVVGQVGVENVRRTADGFGVGQFAATDPSAAPLQGLLDQPVSLLEIVPAYAALANQGSRAGRALDDSQALAPTALLRVEDLDGNILFDWSQPEQLPLTTPALAYLVNHVLSDEPARWASLGRSNALEIGRPAAVQLGRSPEAADVWTVGWTPQVAIGVWIAPQESSASPLPPLAAAGVWNSLARIASSSQPFQGWTAPPGVTSLEVCDPSGMLATVICPSVVSEIFLPGSEPTQPDNFYRVIPMNRETGLRATLFTPPELVEERIFPSLPPDGVEWARQAGLELPPENYDLIAGAAPGEGLPAISAPPAFSAVRGTVPITGSTGAGELSFYRVQAGQGLNPPAWLQIGEQRDQAVASGELAEWDTAGLDGLYSLQLQVVGPDGGLQTATLQVSVDNQPPAPQALYPVDGQEVAARAGELLLRAAAQDNLQIARLDFAIDGSLVGSLSAAPFTLPWRARPGAHELTLTALDTAGNEASVTVAFTVGQ